MRVYPASVHVGEVYPTRDGDLTVKKYINANEVLVEFNTTKFTTTATASNIKKGAVKDPYKPTTFGVGFLGFGQHKANSRRVKSSAYICWYNMLKRCYCKTYQEKQPWYFGCSVVVDWHNFQTFADWYYQNHQEGYELDKDIKVFGNRVYGPETCQFVTPDINRSHKTSYTLRVRGIRKEI